MKDKLRLKLKDASKIITVKYPDTIKFAFNQIWAKTGERIF